MNLLKSVFLASFLVVVSMSDAATTKTYQVTGPVLEVKDDSFIVEKGKEKWEIAKNAEAKVKGELKVGAKVTVQYTMAAKEIEVKK